jgi:arylformamidase
VVKSAVLASGIYDLLPVRLSARNDYVKLDASTERALSPIRHLQRFTGKAYVTCGALESDEFKRQARALAAALDPGQLEAPLAEYAGLNHFEVADTLANPHGGLGRAALGMMGLPTE